MPKGLYFVGRQFSSSVTTLLGITNVCKDKDFSVPPCDITGVLISPQPDRGRKQATVTKAYNTIPRLMVYKQQYKLYKGTVAMAAKIPSQNYQYLQEHAVVTHIKIPKVLFSQKVLNNA